MSENMEGLAYVAWAESVFESKDKRIAELEWRLKESGRIMAQLAEAAEDDGVDGVRWRSIAGDAYDFLTAPEGNADD